jgi:hypothetical protein
MAPLAQSNAFDLLVKGLGHDSGAGASDDCLTDARLPARQAATSSGQADSRTE